MSRAALLLLALAAVIGHATAYAPWQAPGMRQATSGANTQCVQVTSVQLYGSESGYRPCATPNTYYVRPTCDGKPGKVIVTVAPYNSDLVLWHERTNADESNGDVVYMDLKTGDWYAGVRTVDGNVKVNVVQDKNKAATYARNVATTVDGLAYGYDRCGRPASSYPELRSMQSHLINTLNREFSMNLVANDVRLKVGGGHGVDLKVGDNNDVRVKVDQDNVFVNVMKGLGLNVGPNGVFVNVDPNGFDDDGKP